MFEGDMDNGELEIGQVSGLINDIVPAAQVVQDMVAEYDLARKEMIERSLHA